MIISKFQLLALFAVPEVDFCSLTVSVSDSIKSSDDNNVVNKTQIQIKKSFFQDIL